MRFGSYPGSTSIKIKAMASLRAAISTLQRFKPEETLNISDVYKFVFMDRPLSLHALMDKIASLPNSVPFHSTVVTGAALGGEVSVTVNRDGSYRFSGFMRATGAFSFSFRIGAIVRSASGKVMIASQHTGKVFGTDTPGDRKNSWDETITNTRNTQLIRDLWADVSGGKLSISRSSEFNGVFGTAIDVVKDVAEFFVVAQTFGASLAVCLIIGSELGNMGVDVPGMGGIVGIGIVAGSLFIWGPLSIGPAIILGVAAGAIIDALIQIRRLRAEEVTFVKQVFVDSLDFERIRLTNFVGLGGRPFTTPTVDDHILVNIGLNDEMFNSPTTTVIKDSKYTVPGQLLIHELTHAWQIQHASLQNGFVPGFLCEAVREQVFMGKDAYNYGPPGPPWSAFTLEGQAHMVDDWFASSGRQAGLTSALGPRPVTMNPESPYFGYIDNNIRAGSV